MGSRSEENRLYYLEHKAERAAYIEANREAIRAMKARWQAANRRDRTAERAAYREQNRDRLRAAAREYQDRWRAENPEATTVRNAHSRAKRYGVLDTLTLDEWTPKPQNPAGLDSSYSWH